jgi:hypothetical protein
MFDPQKLLYYANMEPETPSSISQVLDYIQRPNYALWNAIGNAADPNVGFWEGARRGWYGEQRTQLGNLLGIDDSSTMGAVGKFLVDTAGAPENLIPVTGLGRLLGRGVGVASDLLKGSAVGKIVGGPASRYGKYAGVEHARAEVMRNVAPQKIAAGKFEREWGELAPLLAGEMGKEVSDIHRLAYQYLEEGLPAFSGLKHEKEATQFLDAMRAASEQSFYTMRDAGIATGRVAPEMLNEFTQEGFNRLYAPHVTSIKGEWRRLGQKAEQHPWGSAPYEMIDPRAQKHRELVRVEPKINLETGEFLQTPIITKLTPRHMERQGLYWDEATGELMKRGPTPHDIMPMQIMPASINDLVKSGAMRHGDFIEDIGKAYRIKINSDLDKANYFLFEKQLEGVTLNGQKVLVPLANVPRHMLASEVWSDGLGQGLGRMLGPKYREVRVHGLEGIAAPAVVANRMEGIANILGDPNLYIGGLENAFRHFFENTQAGKAYQVMQTWWKRNQLGLFPGYYAANAISNFTLLQMQGGPKALLQFPKGVKLAETRFIPDPGDISRYWSGKEFRRMAEEDGIIHGEGFWKEVAGEPGAISASFMEKGGAIGALGKTMDAWRRANNWGFREVGQRTEDYARATLYYHYMEKNGELLKHGAKTLGQLRNEATVFAKEGMIDYGDLSVLDRYLFKQVMPFWAWTRGILGQFAEVGLVNPQRLSMMSRALDATFQGVPESDRRYLPEYFKGQMPIMGWKGAPGAWPFGARESGLPSMMLLSRFLAPGTIEQLSQNPLREFGGMISPLLKTPVELATNWDFYKNRALDPRAEGVAAGLLNPIFGGTYALGESPPLGYNLPAMYEHAILQSPGGRYLRTLDPLLRATGITEDPLRPKPSTWEALAYGATGGKLYEYDITRYQRQFIAKEDRKRQAIKRDLRYYASKGDWVKAAHAQSQLEGLLQERMEQAGNPGPMP